MPKKLTAAALDRLPIGDYHDTILPGLILRVGARYRTWAFRQRVGGQKRRLTLGYYPQMELSAARDAARATMDRLERGAPLAPAAPHPRSPDALTLGMVLDRYEAFRHQEQRRVKTLDASMVVLRAELKPWIGLPLDAFGKVELRQARDAIVDRGALIAANRLLGYVGPFLRWCAQEDLIPHNFTPDIRKPAAERKRERVLKPAELRAIWQAAESLDRGPSSRAFGRLVRFLMVTGQRRDEGASLRYGDILNGVWKQEPEANKSGRAHALKLPAMALQIVGQGEPSELVFRGISGRMSGWGKLKRTLDEACGVTAWRIHDIRRSVASGMQDLGIAHDTVEGVLNHTVRGVAGHYLHGEMERLKAEALARWAEHLHSIVNPPAVVPLRAAR